MNIDGIEIFHVALPLRKPQPWADGNFDSLQTVLVRLQSGGAFGWGEATPGNAPLESGEWAAGAFACLRDWLAPAIAHQAVESGEALQKLLEPFRENRFAKAALDTAWWDLAARQQGKPLHELLEGSRTAVEVGPAFDVMENFDDFIAAIARAKDAGFARVCLKFRPGWDVQMLSAVRREFPGLTLHIDCEAGLHLDQMEMLCRLDDFFLAMIEQPLAWDDLVGHAMVQETVRTPICLDESVNTLAQAQVALELHSCHFVKIDPGRVGGITPALAIYEVCHEECTPCWVGGRLQSALGTRIAYELASKANFTYPADYFSSSELLAADLAEPVLPAADPSDNVQRVALSTQPGIGIVPDAAALAKYTVAKAGI